MTPAQTDDPAAPAVLHHPAENLPLRTLPAAPRPSITSGPVPVVRQGRLSERYYALTLEAPAIARSALPGQFVMLTVARDGEFVPALPRPMAIYSVAPERGEIEILYSVVGDGTRRLTRFAAGDEIVTVGPLGRGFDLGDARHVLLLGRGIGTCSLTTVAQATYSAGVVTTAVSSGRDRSSVIGADLYAAHGVRLYGVTDEAGTSDVAALEQRLVDELTASPPDLVLTCGSKRLAEMATRLGRRWDAGVQVSIEAHMACGLGYCHGCASGARSEGAESPLVCLDGPVFDVALEGFAAADLAVADTTVDEPAPADHSGGEVSR